AGRSYRLRAVPLRLRCSAVRPRGSGDPERQSREIRTSGPGFPLARERTESLHELVGEEAVVRLERLVGLQQPILDVDTFRLLERLRADAQVARRDLAHVLEGDREQAIIELRETLLQECQGLARTIEHDAGCLAEGAADAFAQRLALHTGV